MRIGRLDRKITIGFRRITQDTYGAALTDFDQNTQAVWARLEAQNGRERLDDGKEVSVQLVTFLIRYSTDVRDVTPGDRVTYNSQQYDIESVVELGRNTSLRLVCKLVE